MSAESLKGYQWPESTVAVERGRVAMFANAIGEADPVYSAMSEAARARATWTCWPRHVRVRARSRALRHLGGAGGQRGGCVGRCCTASRSSPTTVMCTPGTSSLLTRRIHRLLLETQRHLGVPGTPLAADLRRRTRRRDGKRIRHPEWGAFVTTDIADVQAGTELPPLVAAPITRTTLALFAGASGDHNPDSRRHRCGQGSRLRRRIRPRHAVDGIPGPTGHLVGSIVTTAHAEHPFHLYHSGSRPTDVYRNRGQHRRGGRREARHRRGEGHPVGRDRDAQRRSRRRHRLTGAYSRALLS